MQFKTLIAIALMVAAPGTRAEQTTDSNKCMDGPMAQFGRYVGDWKIDDESFSRDTGEWQSGVGHRWVFQCIGDGTAVQDFWYPDDGGFGTNLRTYNKETESWEIVWAATSTNGLMHISAEQIADGSIVRNILSPSQEPPRRIIFYPPDKNGWNWTQQWSFDTGETWIDVYRIRATPWSELQDQTH
jgi:hypothetical protein